MKMLDKEITLEIEFIDLENHEIGIICSMAPADNRSGTRSLLRTVVPMLEKVKLQCDRQVAKTTEVKK